MVYVRSSRQLQRSCRDVKNAQLGTILLAPYKTVQHELMTVSLTKPQINTLTFECRDYCVIVYFSSSWRHFLPISPQYPVLTHPPSTSPARVTEFYTHMRYTHRPRLFQTRGEDWNKIWIKLISFWKWFCLVIVLSKYSKSLTILIRFVPLYRCILIISVYYHPA